MQKRMIAKYSGKCSHSGAPIYPGDEIIYDTVTRKAFFTEPGDCRVMDSGSSYLATRTKTKKIYISDVFNVNGREFYRNKQGRCIDAPCCGCCTI